MYNNTKKTSIKDFTENICLNHVLPHFSMQYITMILKEVSSNSGFPGEKEKPQESFQPI